MIMGRQRPTFVSLSAALLVGFRWRIVKTPGGVASNCPAGALRMAIGHRTLE
jgi:hypothetical protein